MRLDKIKGTDLSEVETEQSGLIKRFCMDKGANEIHPISEGCVCQISQSTYCLTHYLQYIKQVKNNGRKNMILV